MTKYELIRDIKASFDNAGLISYRQIETYTGLSRVTVLEMMRGTEYCTLGRKKLFYVGDVASILLKARN